MVENLTSTALSYALIGAIFRVYSWTVLSVIAFFIFQTFKIKQDHKDSKIHYLFLLAIPFFISNAVVYSLKLDITSPVFFVEVIVFIGGLLFLISTLSLYYYFKRKGEI